MSIRLAYAVGCLQITPPSNSNKAVQESSGLKVKPNNHGRSQFWLRSRYTNNPIHWIRALFYANCIWPGHIFDPPKSAPEPRAIHVARLRRAHPSLHRRLLSIRVLFSYIDIIETTHTLLSKDRPYYFLGRKDRVYGAKFGTGPSARLWQEYAKADHRWAVADTTVISLELLTVFLAGPAAIYICYLLYKIASNKNSSKTDAQRLGAAKGKLWLVASAVATGELYGGFMTFAPEWLSANSQLDGSNTVFLWLYLVFFNMLWVFIPFWVLVEAYKELKAAFVNAEVLSMPSDKKQT
uniref:Emopamil-binding protein-like n=1 Tax=Talaromyces marneffei PM1 TaxID=1077442 RepID=A0A093UR98_TALMA